MRMKKYALTLLISFLCVIGMSQEVRAESGTCGTSASWTYDNGVLTVGGTGIVGDNPWMDSYEDSITTVVIQEGVTRVEVSEAFAGCKNLTSVSLPGSLTYLSFYAFKDCTSLTSVTIPKDLTDCGGYCFKGSGVETVTFEDGATVIPESLFIDCSALKTIHFPQSITNIGGGAFEKCTGLTKITLPQSLTNIGFYAFKGCTGITSIIIPKSVTECGGYCFKDSGVETVTFEDGATVVPESLFIECSALKTIYFPQSITKIEGGAFEKCTSLTQVTCPYYLEEIGFYSFKGCTNLKDITIYQKCTKYSDYSFKNVTGLTIHGKKNSEAHKFAKKQGYTFKTCKIPALKGITYTKGNLKYQVVKDYISGKGTVMVTGMKKNAASVTIPKTVKLESYNYKVVKINNNAFKNKSKLKKITIKSTYLTSVGKNAIKGINKNAVIKVPKSKLTAYKRLFKSNTGYKKTMKITK